MNQTPTIDESSPPAGSHYKRNVVIPQKKKKKVACPPFFPFFSIFPLHHIPVSLSFQLLRLDSLGLEFPKLSGDSRFCLP